MHLDVVEVDDDYVTETGTGKGFPDDGPDASGTDYPNPEPSEVRLCHRTPCADGAHGALIVTAYRPNCGVVAHFESRTDDPDAFRPGGLGTAAFDGPRAS